MTSISLYTRYKRIFAVLFSLLLVNIPLASLAAPLTSNEAAEGNKVNKVQVPFFSAEYDALIQGFAVSAKREYKALSPTISELSFSATSMLASLEESSRFSWQQEQIKPLRFSHERIIFGQSRRNILSFDWNKHQIISTTKGKTKVLNNPQEALDRLSFQLQLQHDLSSSKIEDKVYRIADKKKIKEYSFKVVGEELIDTELGQFNTTKVMVVRESQKRVTYIWLAQDWNNLLARLEQYEDGDKQFSLQVTKAVIDGKKVSGL